MPRRRAFEMGHFVTKIYGNQPKMLKMVSYTLLGEFVANGVICLLFGPGFMKKADKR